MRRFKFLRGRSDLGLSLLALWLILNGLAQLISLHFMGMGLILGITAIVAGVLILLGR